ncbi:MAG: hypothetical protein R3E50_11785 [Halioglobus sp.]
MSKALQRIIACLFLATALLAATVIAVAALTLEDTPLVGRGPAPDQAAVAAGKAFLKRVQRQLEMAGAGGVTLAVTEGELGNLAQMGAHTFPWFDAALDIDDTGIDSRVSLRLPANPFGAYLNLGLRIGQSSNGIAIDHVSIGPLQCSGRWLLPLAAKLADVLLRDRQASMLLASVRALRIEDDIAMFSVLPPPDAKTQLKKAVRTLQALRLPPGEERRVGHYYAMLADLGSRRDFQARSLNYYLVPLVREAAARSPNQSAIAENRAVLWALVIYFSNGAFETLVGKLVSGQRALVQAPFPVTLGGRQDLMLHFLYSAGISLATRQGIGVAAGEFKELLDSGKGGSGFSFADLAADRAGIEFVSVATSSESAARRWQARILARPDEGSYFPDVTGLTEDLSEEQFRREYGSIESARYREAVALIDRRISRLTVYASTTTP